MPVSKDYIEWLRSPDAADKNLTSSELKAHEELHRRTELLNSHIRAAFKGYTLGDGIGLLEADAWDMCVDREKPRLAREQDERDSWELLSPDDLYRYSQALCFTDAEGFRFLLPAFMLADLDGGVDEMIIIHLSLTNDDPKGIRALLNRDQVATVIEFLNLFLDDPDCNFHHESITKSLGTFWNPLIQLRIEEAEQVGDADAEGAV